ncbi:MAG: DUF4012 domain-containing protein [Micrococcaceae bacterium]
MAQDGKYEDFFPHGSGPDGSPKKKKRKRSSSSSSSGSSSSSSSSSGVKRKRKRRSSSSSSSNPSSSSSSNSSSPQKRRKKRSFSESASEGNWNKPPKTSSSSGSSSSGSSGKKRKRKKRNTAEFDKAFSKDSGRSSSDFSQSLSDKIASLNLSRFAIDPGKFLKYFVIIVTICVFWLGIRGVQAGIALRKVNAGVPALQQAFAKNDTNAITNQLTAMKKSAKSAHSATSDPIWRLAKYIPLIGANFEAASAVSDVAYSVTKPINQDLTNKIANYQTVFEPKNGKFDINAIKDLSQEVSPIANDTANSAAEVAVINPDSLVSAARQPFSEAQTKIAPLGIQAKNFSATLKLLPDMLGASGERNYLVVNQNNAELRGSGGHPGSFTLLNANQGVLKIGEQYTPQEFNKLPNPVLIDKSFTKTFGSSIAQNMIIFNTSPDWPTNGKLAHDIFKQDKGFDVDGVIGVDPTALSHILDATGPVSVDGIAGLPSQINAQNVVQILLSDAYKNTTPTQQDDYFAKVSDQVFNQIAAGKFDGAKLIEGLGKAANENRFLVWSNTDPEQQLLESTEVGGDVMNPVQAPAAYMYGVAINNLQQSKMDYYLKDSIQLAQAGCGTDKNNVTVMNYTVTNTLNIDPNSLPEYVTGSVRLSTPGFVKGELYDEYTFYAPAGTEFNSVKVDGKDAGVALSNMVNLQTATVILHTAPGQTHKVAMTFSGVDVTHKPGVRLTPTVQNLDSRIQEPTIEGTCGK